MCLCVCRYARVRVRAGPRGPPAFVLQCFGLACRGNKTFEVLSALEELAIRDLIYFQFLCFFSISPQGCVLYVGGEGIRPFAFIYLISG